MAHILDLMELKQILRLHMDGLSNRRISDTLGIHRNTINSYVSQFKASKHGIEELLKLSDYELAQLFPGHTTIKNPRFDELMQFFTNMRSEEHTSELQSRPHLVCRLLLEKKKKKSNYKI